MKKIKVNYVKNYNEKTAFENLKNFFINAKNQVEKTEHEKKINLNFTVEPEKIVLNDKIKSFLQIEFLLEKKAIAFLFQNYIQQIKDKSEFDLSVKIQYTQKSLKTLKKLFNIFTEDKAFFEIKKSELNDFLIAKFNKTIEKTANLTIDENFMLPEFINDKTFVSAHLITEATEKTVKITNKFKDLQEFVK
jgi:hypothetical protein